jgi:hypothetical protein
MLYITFTDIDFFLFLSKHVNSVIHILYGAITKKKLFSFSSNGCPRNNESLSILLISLSKIIRSRLIFFPDDSSFHPLQEPIFRISFERILSPVYDEK